jgi:hypothetical protein
MKKDSVILVSSLVSGFSFFVVTYIYVINCAGVLLA